MWWVCESTSVFVNGQCFARTCYGQTDNTNLNLVQKSAIFSKWIKANNVWQLCVNNRFGIWLIRHAPCLTWRISFSFSSSDHIYCCFFKFYSRKKNIHSSRRVRILYFLSNSSTATSVRTTTDWRNEFEVFSNGSEWLLSQLKSVATFWTTRRGWPLIQTSFNIHRLLSDHEKPLALSHSPWTRLRCFRPVR